MWYFVSLVVFEIRERSFIPRYIPVKRVVTCLYKRLISYQLMKESEKDIPGICTCGGIVVRSNLQSSY